MAENILHFVGCRLRVNGIANLKITVIGLDDAETYEAKPLPIVESSGIEPFRRVNFKSQRARFRFYTTKVNETIRINRIVIFSKPVAASYPM